MQITIREVCRTIVLAFLHLMARPLYFLQRSVDGLIDKLNAISSSTEGSADPTKVTIDKAKKSSMFQRTNSEIEKLKAEFIILHFRLSLNERATGYNSLRAVEALDLHSDLSIEEIERRIRYYGGL